MISLAFSLLSVFTVGAEEAPTVISQFREMATAYLQKTSEPRELYKLGEDISHLYFKKADENERAAIEAELGAILRAHRELGPFFIPLGNAFHDEAQILDDARESKVTKIRILTAGVSAVVGILILKGALNLKMMPPALVDHKTLSVLGGAIAGAGIGYFIFGKAAAWALLPYDEVAKTADDFLDRYPNGIDFLRAASDPTWADPLDEFR